MQVVPWRDQAVVIPVTLVIFPLDVQCQLCSSDLYLPVSFRGDVL